MIRYTAPFFVGIVAACATFLFSTSQSVQQAESRLEDLRAALAREKQSVRVLRAEWDYLNRPDRIEALAQRYLDLVPPAGEELIASIDALAPAMTEAPPTPAERAGSGIRQSVADEPLIPVPSLPPRASSTPAPSSPAPAVFSAKSPVPAPRGGYRSFDEILSRVENAREAGR